MWIFWYKIFVLIMCCLLLQITAQSAEYEDKAENSPVIYGCDDKVIDELRVTLNTVESANDKMMFKLNLIEQKMEEIDKTIMKALETQFNKMASNFMKSVVSTKLNIKDELESLERKIKSLNELSSKFQFSAEAVPEIIQTKASAAKEEKSAKLEKYVEFIDGVEKHARNVEPELEQPSAYSSNTFLNKNAPMTPKILPARYTSNIFLNKSNKNITESLESADVLKADRKDGVYELYIPGHRFFKAYGIHDPLDKYGPIWTVIQRRRTGSILFNRNRDSYAKGFGNFSDSYWLGLEHVHAMTSRQNYELLIGLEDWNGQKRYAKYDRFRIASGKEAYALIELGTYSGTAGDSFSKQLHRKFSIKNSKTGDMTMSCGWWNAEDGYCHLNGIYNSTAFGWGVNWEAWHGLGYSLKNTQMAIRPRKI